MRFLTSLLLAALVATGSPGAMTAADCCAGEASHGHCHKVPAGPVPCHAIQATACVDLICKPEAESAIALTTVRSGAEVSRSFVRGALPVDWVPNSLQSTADARPTGEIPHVSGKQFLKHCVLQI